MVTRNDKNQDAISENNVTGSRQAPINMSAILKIVLVSLCLLSAFSESKPTQEPVPIVIWHGMGKFFGATISYLMVVFSTFRVSKILFNKD